jgi:hypothetical protein
VKCKQHEVRIVHLDNSLGPRECFVCREIIAALGRAIGENEMTDYDGLEERSDGEGAGVASRKGRGLVLDGAERIAAERSSNPSWCRRS